MIKGIVYTRNTDGGVAVCWPAPEIVRALALGSYYGVPERGFCDKIISRKIAMGVLPDAARRFVHALRDGGCTTAEAHAIVRDHSCAHLGRHFDLTDYADLPDRWFRNAWRRSHNGGPVGVDMKFARPLQWSRARGAVAAENKRRVEAFEVERPIEPDWQQIRTAIRHATDEEELRRVWPLPSRRIAAPAAASQLR